MKMVFKEAEAAVDNAPDDWSDAQLGKLYKDISYHYYLESEFPQAFTYIEKAIARIQHISIRWSMPGSLLKQTDDWTL